MLLRSEDDLSSTRLLVSQNFEDEKETEAKPLLSMASSYTNTSKATTTGAANFYQKRRRRPASDDSPSFSSDCGLHSRGQSFREGVGHAASETYLMTRLGFDLLRYLG